MATITESGSATGLILYSGEYDLYIRKASINFMQKVKTDRIKAGFGYSIEELIFDNQTQRDAAFTTLLTYF